MNATHTYQVELTDTYGGEANYAWVRRATIQVPEGASDRSIVRQAKAAIGLTGVRCSTSSYGDTIQLDIVGACQRCFISWDDSSTNA